MNTLQTRFGQIQFDESDVVTFSDGIIGFTTLRRFVLMSHNPESPFRWLQSVDEPSLAFLVVEPGRYVEDYVFEIEDHTAAELQMDETTTPTVYTTVSIPPGKPKEMTINLMAPLVVNPHAKLGRQVVLESEAYTMKHRVFAEDRDGDRAAA